MISALLLLMATIEGSDEETRKKRRGIVPVPATPVPAAAVAKTLAQQFSDGKLYRLVFAHLTLMLIGHRRIDGDLQQP